MTMKEDERTLIEALRADRGAAHRSGSFADEVGARLGMHHKRVAYVLSKSERRGWWQSGVSQRSGWFTKSGWDATDFSEPGIVDRIAGAIVGAVVGAVVGAIFGAGAPK